MVAYIRAGHSSSNSEISDDEFSPTYGSSSREKGEEVDHDGEEQAGKPPSNPKKKTKIRLASSVIENILENERNEESIQLRQLIDRRAEEYAAELEAGGPKSPLKVLHYLAPKVPAIKHSPDYMLRIQTARGDIDSGVAASIIVTLARLCILYDDRTKRQKQPGAPPIAAEICKDRRFEQLIECVLCGVDVRKRKREFQQMEQDETEEESFDMEELLDEENAKIEQGLEVEDACRAAWGISMICGYETTSFGGQKVNDILLALSLQIRERLLARLQLLRQGELRFDIGADQTLMDGLDRDAERLAEDVATAIWTFACVKATSGLRTVPLFEACCSILCQNPTQLREREQAKQNNTSYEVDGVVDRLAKSEKSENVFSSLEGHSETSSGLTSDDRDALLHWLSPGEVCGTMWAVALHGRTDNAASKQEMNLSETAAVLSEIAFDRIHDWLFGDWHALKEAEASKDSTQNMRDNDMEREVLSRGDGVVLEVVDAAALLAKEHSETVLEAAGEDMAGNELLQNEIQVQAVDAATLLATEEKSDVQKPVHHSSFNEPPSDDEASMPLGLSPLTFSPSSKAPFLSSSKAPLRFSNSELCSIVWAANDLHDSLRNVLVDLVSALLVDQGKRGIEQLDGGDLSNLAWAIARRTELCQDNSTDLRLVQLVEWIAERSLIIIKSKGNDRIFDHFQPPELGRMMWSLSLAVSNLSQRVRINTRPRDFAQLGILTLQVAHTNSSMFGTEDLARIIWGFIELSQLEESLMDPMLSLALGRLVEIMEASVLRWESGQCEKSRKEKENIAFVDESIRFTTFLGKPRLALRLLEQRLDTRMDDDDDAPSEDPEKTKLPLLRDLSMDPASMCKLASALSRTKGVFPEIDGAWTFTRVAVRLLSSKHGQLLKVTSIADCVRLAFACAMNDSHGYDRELVTRLYARRFVQRLNDMSEESDHPYLSQRFDLPAREMSTMIWSLGQLGVRLWRNQENGAGIAFKKLRLICDVPLLPPSEIESLSIKPLVRLLCGVVSMNIMSSSPSMLSTFLGALIEKIQDNVAAVELCDLVECLAKIRATNGEVNVTTSVSAEIPVAVVANTTNTAEKQENRASPSAFDVGSGKSKEVGEPNNHAFDLIPDICERLLTMAAEIATKQVQSYTAGHLRRLLSVYSGLPFQADQLIESIEREIDNRMETATALSNLFESVNQVTNAAQASLDALSDKLEHDSSRLLLSTLRNGLKKVFLQDTEGKEKKTDTADAEKLKKICELMEDAAAKANNVRDELLGASKLANGDPSALLSPLQRGSVFELSRCQELVESYRRVCFKTGKRESRKDGLLHTQIGKYVIGRKFTR